MKRILDLTIVFCLAPLWLPLMAFVSLMVWYRLGAPIFFKQERPGHKGKPFKLIKYRTMLSLHDDHGNFLPDQDRLTSFGRWLRSTSLDELPELWNVIRGDMSLVGPRPLLTEYLPLYDAFQARRHEVPPGLTGWAQVNGRNALTWTEKFEHDIYYVDNCSTWFDLKILWSTFWTVLFRRGIQAPDHATMPPFQGNLRD
jgi:sugar transferase EpsL